MLTKGKVSGIISNLVIVDADGPVSQNEICMIEHEGTRLMAEVIKLHRNQAFVQVFESTRGLRIGSDVEFTGSMLEAALGPGILSRNYDGLQNDLDRLEGVFLKKGEYNFPLDEEHLWDFKPLAEPGETVEAGSWLGEVIENWIPHKIMVPFKFSGSYTLKWIADEGSYKVNDVIAIVTDSRGEEHQLTMVQKWPVKLAVKAYKTKYRPFQDHGDRGQGYRYPQSHCGRRNRFYPGPFGCGKDSSSACSSQAGRCRYGGCCSMRRKGKRGGGDIQGIPSPDRCKNGQQTDRTNNHYSQHLEYARGST
jgi:V/A-type H+/Na+-transporting ATPase subunit A